MNINLDLKILDEINIKLGFDVNQLKLSRPLI